MSEMLHRVAEAIEDHIKDNRPNSALGLARAAIEAMRKPTRGMLSAGSDEIDYSDFAGKLPSDGLAAAWSRMIGEAIVGVQDEFDPLPASAPTDATSRSGQHDAPGILES
jgi:hypothetical protein